MKTWLKALLAIATTGLVAACGGGGSGTDDNAAGGTTPPQATLADALSATGRTQTMAGAATAAGLAATLAGDRNYTLLMPSDEAMAPYAEELAELGKPENRAALESYVRAHMVDGKLLADALQQTATASGSSNADRAGALNAQASVSITIKNILGDDIEITVSGGTITINGASFTQADIVAGNGVLHIFSGPIFRPSVFGIVRESRQTSTLEAAIRAAGLVDALRTSPSLTLFAPTNAAFDALLRELNLTAEQLLANRPLLTQVLTYHVLGSRVLARQIENGATPQTLQGQNITLNTSRDGFGQRVIEITDARDRKAKVTLTNLRARNGVVHLIDRVILPTDRNIVQVAAANPAFSTLVAAVQAAGLVDTLSAPGPFTVFAPTNDAFASLLAELNVSAAQLLGNRPLLTSVLTYHVLASRQLAADLNNGKTLTTVQGQVFKTERSASGIAIVDARGRTSNVVIANVQASNGVVHAIDRVILPADRNIVQTAQSISDFSILVEAVVAAGLVDTLSSPGPFTVFAPTNAAFAALLGELGVTKAQLLADRALLTTVLTYHVLPGRVLAADIRDGATPTTVQGQTFRLDTDGGRLTITDGRGRVSNIVATDVQASNGVVHVIDRVILPRASDPPPPPAPNVVQIAQSSADFSILVEAVVAAGLVDTLSSPGPFTVFAPTNAAFAALLGELGVTKAQLLADRALLTTVLTYHVLPSRVLAADIRDGAQPTTVQGQVFRLGLAGGPNIVDARDRKANIVRTDLVASNGVVHVIDRVILPQGKNIVQLALDAPQFSVLVEAVVAAGLQDALSGAGPLTVFAPTNAAFADLLHLLRISKAQLLADRALLTKVLTYHVLPTKVLAKDVTDGATPTTLQGETFMLRRSSGSIQIVDQRGRTSRVTATDTQASNGVIHTIDRVILPRP
jgi:transforming growth factor-beta-induced protein